MPEFLVKLADERGHVLEQVESANSERELRDRFVHQGFHVYSVRPRGVFAGGTPRLGRGRLKTEPFIIFNQQFLTLIRAGLPILTSLELLVKRQRNDHLKSLLQNVRNRVRTGEVLSQAFAAQPGMPKIYTTTLLAGEKSGNLEEVLQRYITFQRLALSFRKKLLSSLVYPALLMVLVSLMLVFLMTYVIPQFSKLYDQLGSQLPPLTAFMLQVGLFAQSYFPFLGIGFLLLIVLIWRWRETESGGQTIDRARLRLPLLGEIWLKYQVSIFARMMSTLLAGGLPLVPALETAGGSMQSRLISSAVAQAAQRVREGRPLAASLEDTGVFPELAIEMIEVGESTGALPQMLASAAEFYEEDVETALTAAMSLIEPIILIIMGIIVAFVLLSLYLPIFTLGSGGIPQRGGI